MRMTTSYDGRDEGKERNAGRRDGKLIGDQHRGAEMLFCTETRRVAVESTTLDPPMCDE